MTAAKANSLISMPIIFATTAVLPHIPDRGKLLRGELVNPTSCIDKDEQQLTTPPARKKMPVKQSTMRTASHGIAVTNSVTIPRKASMIPQAPVKIAKRYWTGLTGGSEPASVYFASRWICLLGSVRRMRFTRRARKTRVRKRLSSMVMVEHWLRIA
ncbi:hypothetical protein KC318_g36 [Hortaea werneckii]|nr:hypothetical protein KC334_g33 [Hortaea werneckii]KAI7676813.1 hypothetical protein KC318_g36 [Hortaea werneckii]